MKPLYILLAWVIIGAIPPMAHAQQMLPDFSVRELTKGKIQISWNNPYRNCIQLAIQRSADSSKNFRTIFSAQSPELANNGFVDSKPLPLTKIYYRIFFTLEGGSYFFTRSIPVMLQPVTEFKKDTRPETIETIVTEGINMDKLLGKDITSIYIRKQMVFRLTKTEYTRFKDSINTKTKDFLHRLNEHAVEWKPALLPNKQELISIYKKGSLLASLGKKAYQHFKDSIKTNTSDTLFVVNKFRVQLYFYMAPQKQLVLLYRNYILIQALEASQYKKFKDSIATKTKDTLFATDNQHVNIHPYVPKYVWKPSNYVFTNSKGYVTILLPQVKQHKYHVIFYEENGAEVFRIKTLKEPELVLDKTDFEHAGWFFFELFEDDKLIEKNKILLTKD